MKKFIICVVLLAAAPAVAFEVEQYGSLGQHGANPFGPNSTANGLGAFGNPYGNIINDPDNPYGMPYGDHGETDSNDASGPGFVDKQGNFWSKFSITPNDPGSASKPIGRFGNPYSPDINNNPYGAGSPYAPNSTGNPYYGNGSIIIGR